MYSRKGSVITTTILTFNATDDEKNVPSNKQIADDLLSNTTTVSALKITSNSVTVNGNLSKKKSLSDSLSLSLSLSLYI